MYTVETDGLKEALAGMDRLARLDATRDLKAQFAKMAEDAIAQAKVNAGSRMRQKAADTLASASTGTYAALRFGRGFDGAFGAEFGAGRNQRRVVSHFGYFTGWNQFAFWRGSGTAAGYFLWPAIRKSAEANVELLAEGVAAFVAQGDNPTGRGQSLIDSVFAQTDALVAGRR